VTQIRKPILSIAIAALLAAGVLAQQTPSIDQILAHYVAALGGRDAILKITSRHVKGTVELEGLADKAAAESFAKAPNKYVATVTFEKIGANRRGFDGSSGWASDPQHGIVDLAGEDLSSFGRSADMFQAINIPKNYPKLTLKGTEDVNGKPAYIILGEPSDGGSRQMDFDVASGLLLRTIDNTGQGGAGVITTTDIQDYRVVSGVQYPYVLVEHLLSPDGTTTVLTIRLTDVQCNVPVDDSVFTKPTQ
jgi:hypothetical protein